MTKHRELPLRTWRTGTETFTIIDAHPYHYPIGRIDHKGAGEYERGYKAECPLCRAEEQKGKTRYILFVGDKRSKTAREKGWTWDDERLSGRTLLDALEACGLSRVVRIWCIVNAYDDDGGENHQTRELVHRLVHLLYLSA